MFVRFLLSLRRITLIDTALIDRPLLPSFGSSDDGIWSAMHGAVSMVIDCGEHMFGNSHYDVLPCYIPLAS